MYAKHNVPFHSTSHSHLRDPQNGPGVVRALVSTGLWQDLMQALLTSSVSLWLSPAGVSNLLTLFVTAITTPTLGDHERSALFVEIYDAALITLIHESRLQKLIQWYAIAMVTFYQGLSMTKDATLLSIPLDICIISITILTVALI